MAGRMRGIALGVVLGVIFLVLLLWMDNEMLSPLPEGLSTYANEICIESLTRSCSRSSISTNPRRP